MEFKKAALIWNRMCNKAYSCNSCLLRDQCIMNKDFDPDHAEAILAKWADAHPEKTIADDFFDKHPKAKYLDDMVPGVCAFYCGYDKPEYCQKDAAVCANCWRRPLEEAHHETN